MDDVDRKTCQEGIQQNVIKIIVEFEKSMCLFKIVSNEILTYRIVMIIIFFHLVLNICALFDALNCSYGCRFDDNNFNKGYCFCPSGFELDFDNSSCKGLYFKAVVLYLRICVICMSLCDQRCKIDSFRCQCNQ